MLVAVAAVAAALRGGFKDLLVYQYAGRAVLDAVPLYASRDPVNGLRFTYPPFAAVGLSPQWRRSRASSWWYAARWVGPRPDGWWPS